MRVANIRALNVAETCSQSGSIKIASIAFRFIVGSNTLYRLRKIYIYIYIYILFVTTANLWPPRSLRIYIYTRIHIYIYIYSFDFIIRSHFCSSDPRIKPFVLWGPLILKTLSGVALAIAAEGAG